MRTGTVSAADIARRGYSLSATDHLVEDQLVPRVLEHLGKAQALISVAASQGVTMRRPTATMIAGDLGVPVAYVKLALRHIQ